MAPKFVFKHYLKPQAAGKTTTNIRASQLSPKPATSASIARSEAPVEISVLQYIGQAGAIVTGLPEPLHDQPLYQVQLRHDARPSLLMKTILNFNNYLADLHSQQPGVPSSLQHLRDEGIQLQIVNSQRDSGPMVPWRIAFYVTGDVPALVNALQLIDSFLDWRGAHVAEGEAAFPPQTQVQLTVPSSLHQALSQETWTNSTSITIPPRFSPFQAAPPSGHHLQFVIECATDGIVLQGTFLGCTWPFRRELEEHGVLGARTADDQYVRVVELLDATKQPDRTWLLATILLDVLKEIVLGVEVIERPPDDSPAADFLGLIMDLPQVYLLP